MVKFRKGEEKKCDKCDTSKENRHEQKQMQKSFDRTAEHHTIYK